MNTSSLYAYLRQKAHVTEGFPFGENTLVLKVGGKIFAIVNLEEVPTRINLKCDPERAVELREEYDDIIPGYHMNKRHWNTVVLSGEIPSKLIKELIDHSYALVVSSLPRKTKEELGL